MNESQGMLFDVTAHGFTPKPLPVASAIAPAPKTKDVPADFARLLADNPGLYEECAAMALDEKRRGKKKWSARTIIEILRWKRQTVHDDGDFGISNVYSPLLARKLMADYPELEGFFDLKESRFV